MYDYMKPKYGEKAKLCCGGTHSFIISLKPEDICVDIAKHFETRLSTSVYELDRQLPKWKNKKVTRLTKLNGKIMTEFAALWPKT